MKLLYHLSHSRRASFVTLQESDLHHVEQILSCQVTRILVASCPTLPSLESLSHCRPRR